MRHLFRWFGIYMFKCDDCEHRFKAVIYRPKNLFFAKCSRCHRMDLSRWTREYYSPGLVTRVMLALGAKAVRCEYCRHNFWSFRLVREKFSKAKRFARSQVVVAVEDAANTVSEDNRVQTNL
jgi:endogenous inhibitor of DNA gyrase (YacG/DUF329 family)